MAASDLGSGYQPLAVTDRSGRDESVHFGALVGLDASGVEVLVVGDPQIEIYPRSALKPLQADAMVALGLDVPSEQLALACASHDGTDRHVAVVRQLLAAAGFGEEALANVHSLPLDRATADDVLRNGGGPSAVQMNCSGKHAAMLATCAHNGWPSEGYTAIDHRLQQAITAHIAELAGGVTHVGVDGCGAPTHMVSLAGIASAFRQLALAPTPVAAAMQAHPELVGGETRPVTRLMRAVPGLIAKDGAEGVFVAADADGRAVAVKISDGAMRAASVVVAAALARLGVGVEPGEFAEPVLGHGEPVGAIRAEW